MFRQGARLRWLAMGGQTGRRRPRGGFSRLPSAPLDAVAVEVQGSPMHVALVWLLQRAQNILLIPGTGSLNHLMQNLAAARLALPP